MSPNEARKENERHEAELRYNEKKVREASARNAAARNDGTAYVHAPNFSVTPVKAKATVNGLGEIEIEVFEMQFQNAKAIFSTRKEAVAAGKIKKLEWKAMNGNAHEIKKVKLRLCAAVEKINTTFQKLPENLKKDQEITALFAAAIRTINTISGAL